MKQLLEKAQMQTLFVEFSRGALLAQNAEEFVNWQESDDVTAISDGECPKILGFEKVALEKELGWRSVWRKLPSISNDKGEANNASDRDSQSARSTYKDLAGGWRQYWFQSGRVHSLVACCCLGAALQGWVESAVNGG